MASLPAPQSPDCELLHYIGRHGVVTIDYVIAALDLSRATAYRHIASCIEGRLLERFTLSSLKAAATACHPQRPTLRRSTRPTQRRGLPFLGRPSRLTPELYRSPVDRRFFLALRSAAGTLIVCLSGPTPFTRPLFNRIVAMNSCYCSSRAIRTDPLGEQLVQVLGCSQSTGSLARPGKGAKRRTAGTSQFSGVHGMSVRQMGPLLPIEADPFRVPVDRRIDLCLHAPRAEAVSADG